MVSRMPLTYFNFFFIASEMFGVFLNYIVIILHQAIVECMETFQAFFVCVFRRGIAYVKSSQKWKHLETSCVDKLILYRNTSMLVPMQFPKTNSRGIKVTL